MRPRSNGKILTSSRMHGSEEALAMIVGGLGMGFTLRATLGTAASRHFG
jgi:hypothetical protein